MIRREYKPGLPEKVEERSLMENTRILLVEDEAIIALDAKNMLTALGYTVIGVVSSGEESVDQAKALVPDLVLMDIILDGEIDGIEAARRIRAELNIPVIYMTAHADIATVRRARDTAPYGYVLKPINQPDLFSTIDSALNRYYLEVELREKNMQLQALNEEMEATNEELEATNEELKAINEEVTNSQREIYEANILARENERKYRELVEGANSVVLRWKSDGTILFINRFGIEFFGYAEDELIGRSVLDTIVPEIESTGRYLHLLVMDVFQNPEDHHVDVNENIRKNGERVWVSWTSKPVFDDSGQVVEMLSIGNDLSSLKEAELAVEEAGNALLRESAMLAGIIDLNPYSMQVVEPDGRVSKVNQAFINLFGIAPPENYNFFDDPIARRLGICERMNRVLQGEIVVLENIPYNVHDHIPEAPDRDIVIRMVIFPVQGREGNVERVVAMHEDITLRMKAESALKESEERYRQLYEMESDAILLIDVETLRVIEANRAAETMFGYSKDEILGMRIDDLSAEPDQTRQAIFSHQNHIPIRRYRKRDGELFPVEITTHYFDLQGRMVTLAAVRDITRRVEIERDLEESRRRYESLVANIPVGVYRFVTRFSGEMNFEYVSPRFCEMMGITGEQVYADWQNVFRVMHPDDYDSLVGMNLRAGQTGTPFVWEGRITVRGKERWLRIESAPTRLENGDIIMDGIQTDITESRKSEQEILAKNSELEMLAERLEATVAALESANRDVAAANEELRSTQRRLSESMDVLGRSEERFSRAFHSNPTLMTIVTLDEGRYVEVNDAAIQYSGYSREEVIGKTMAGLGVYSRAQVREMSDLIARDGRIRNHEITYRRKGGEERISLLNAEVIELDGVKHVIGSTLDITGIRKAELELNSLGSLLESILKVTPNLMAVATIDEGRYLMVSDSFYDFIGVTREEMEGKTSRDLDVWMEPSDHGRVLEAIRRDGRIINGEIRFRKKNGEKHHALFSVLPVEFQGVRCFLSVATDITGLKNANAMFSAVFDLAPEPMALSTLAEGRFLMVNKSFEEVTGFDRSYCVGKTSKELGIWVTSNDRSGMVEVLEREGRISGSDVVFKKKNGEKIDIQFSAVVIEVEGAQSLLSMAIDVSERKKAALAMTEKNEELEALNEELQATNEEFEAINEELIASQQDLTDAYEKLKRSEEMFQAAFHSNPAAMTITVMGGGPLIELNEAALRYGGYSRAEAIGRTMEDLGIYPPSVLRDMNRRLAGDGFIRDMEVEFRTKSGEVRSGILSADVIEIAGARHVLASTTDITESRIAQQALHVSEKRFRDLVMLLPVGVYESDDRARLTFANEAALDIFGYSANEIAAGGMTTFDMLAPHERERSASLRTMILEKGIVLNLSYDGMKKDGTLFPIMIHSCLIDPDNPAMGTRGVIIDMTEQKRSEEALRTSEEMYRAIFENTGNASIIIEDDTTISLANTKWVQLSGYGKDECEGVMSWTVFADPGDVERMMVYHRQRRIDASLPPAEYEFTFRRKNGEVRNAICNVGLIPGTSKSIVSLLDITDMKNAERKLKESETLYRSIFENTGNASIIIESDTRISLVNSQWERISGYRRDEVEGKRSWTEFVVPEDLERMREYHRTRRVEPGSAPWAYEFRFVNRFGEIRNMVNHVAMVPDTKKSIASLLDITERKRAEDALQRSVKEKDLLIKEIHHRVKNNLQVISSLLNLQSENISDPHTRAVFMESQNRVRSMAHIHEMLYQSDNFDSIDFSVYARRVASEINGSYAESGRSVEMRYDFMPVMLGIDRAIPLGLVLNELLTNAFKYAFRGRSKGVLEIELKSEHVGEPGLGARKVRMLIRDDGVGLPEGLDLDSLKTLGLTMVRLLAERQLDGDFTLETGKAGTQIAVEFIIRDH